jgi:hypothetical protein
MDLWKKYDFKQFNIEGDALLYIKNITYFIDTGRNWNFNNLRDKIDSNQNIVINNTDELLKQLIKKR